MDKFRARVAKFSKVGYKDLVLLLNVTKYNPTTSTWDDFREHLWVENHRKGQTKYKILKKYQTYIIEFEGVTYHYLSGLTTEKVGIIIKNPQNIKYFKQNKKKRSKR